jgi:uncharacterized protein YndB with AHSA1/START domain
MKKAKDIGQMDGEGLERSLVLSATIAKAFQTVATRKGIASWWTPIVRGEVAEGKEFELGFKGLEETIRIRVDASREPKLVSWTIVEHSGLHEWDGTKVKFAFITSDANKTILKFCHVGLVPKLQCYSDCRSGWEHFLGSLADVAGGGGGSPCGI